mgnify:CR=1 FL=1
MTRIPGPPSFDCVICERHIENRWPGPRQTWSLPPVCRYCETTWSGRIDPVGAFRDRRVLAQAGALANALEQTALQQQWGRRYGSA